MKQILVISFFISIVAGVLGKYDSPCPKVIEITNIDKENGIFEAELNLNIEFPLIGLWLKVILDKNAALSTSYPSEIYTVDNTQFLIKNRDIQLVPGQLLKVPITVKYSPGVEIPNIVTVRLNARTMCPPTTAKIIECPNNFSYDDKNGVNEWHGTITLDSEFELTGLWIRVILDKVADLSSDNFADVSTEDQKSYLIKNREFHFIPGQPTRIPITVKYPSNEDIPIVTAIRLNGRPICDKRL